MGRLLGAMRDGAWALRSFCGVWLTILGVSALVAALAWLVDANHISTG